MADEPSINDLEEVTVPERELKNPEAPITCTFPMDIESRFTGKTTFRPVNEAGDPDTHTITLPIPAGLMFADAASYENAELDPLADKIASGEFMKSVQSYMDADNFGERASVAVKDTAARIGGNKVRASMGRTPNPNTRALFKQVSLRTFQFNYKLIPESDKEAEEITKLVRIFRQELYPTSTSTNPDDFQTGYFFPKRFQIKFYLLEGGSQGKLIETDDVPRIQPAYLQSFSASYNTGGPTMFIDTAGSNKARFSEVDIAMTFMESRTLFKPDVQPKDGF